MKKVLLLLISALTLLAYTGFMQPKPGAWAKYELDADGKKMVMITKYLGTTTYKGKKVNIVETETIVDGQKMVMQEWSAVDNDSLIQKRIMLTPMGIMCMEEELYGTSPGEEAPGSLHTPEKYSPKRPNIKLGTYTLPNGKKIKVAIFKDEDAEVWVSSEVPFGTVQVIHDGKPVVKLVDFGLSGAKAAIPLDEAKSCSAVKFPFPVM